jgi:hypothetical protein
MLILYLAVVVTALYFISRVLLPEMIKPLPRTVSQSKDSDDSQSNETGNRVEKLETLLAEKNKNISLLQTELKIFCAQVRDFDKIKSLLEEEIHHLREQNRIFRSELGISTITSSGDSPSAKLKENSIT